MNNVINVEFGKGKKLVYGHGLNDVKGGSTKHREAYRRWISMLQRCYDPKLHERRPTYIGCSVSADWLRFSNFLAWYESLTEEQKTYQLDKDLLDPSNKVYSPETCIMVPSWVNSFVIDCGRARGNLPIGVCWTGQGAKYGKPFVTQICVHGTLKTIGYFTNPNEAHEAWRAAKIKLVHEMADELNAIDHRLYPALLSRYGYSMALAA